ncbi:unnamed protein product [Effrenium voratum]|uniref:Alpha/beta hydrolase fold-3 domain-containing protein n=1 Tax=Effrenium voratum TaxID=2562239 RepID=A0AA36MXJ9_9DINO|nr:unnamed protein product [Effrenium voratum]CAJ1441345.1 unnamed protein product [Effrenium voratum]
MRPLIAAACASLAHAQAPHLLLADNGMHSFMTESTSYCYRHLLADPLCCKDQRVPGGVRHQEIVREGGSWTCGDGCADELKGERGKDLLWWPQAADCSSPRVLFVHGGGWQRHGPGQASYNVLAANLAEVSRAAILVPDYVLVPMGNYLSIIGYLFDAWSWLAKHGPAGEDCSHAPQPPLFLAGDSSGAASALSLLLRLRDEAAAPKAAGFFAFSPWLNLACDSPTYYSNAFSLVDDISGKVIVGDILFRGAPANVSGSLRQLAMKYFQGDQTRLRDPSFSPFHADEVHLDSLPPLYLAVSGTEVLGGDGIIFAQRAAWRGVRVYLDIFPGMWHGFHQYIEGCGSGTELWQGSAAVSHAGDFVMKVTEFVRSSDSGQLPQSGERLPRTNVYYPHPEGKEPWSFVGELDLGFIHQAFQPGQPASRAAPNPQLSLVAPRALPQDVIIDCPKATVLGAIMAGMLSGSIFTLLSGLCGAWFLSRRAHGELPEFLPDFLKHPFENYQDEQSPTRPLRRP